MNIYQRYWKERKFTAICLIIFMVVYNMITKHIDTTKDLKTFLLYYLLIPLIYTLLLQYVFHKFIKKPKKEEKE